MHSINPCVEILISIFPLEYCDFFFPLFSWLGGSSFRGFHLAFPSTVTYFTGQRTNVNMRVMPTINYIHSDCIFENRDAQQLVCKASHWSISHTKSRRWSWDKITHQASHMLLFFLTNWRFLAILHQASLTSAICSLPVSVLPGGDAGNSSDVFVVTVFVMLICGQWPLITTVSKRAWLTEGSGDG